MSRCCYNNCTIYIIRKNYVKSCLFFAMCAITVLTISFDLIYYSPKIHTEHFHSNCTNRLIRLTFQELFKLNEIKIETNTTIALIVADGIRFDDDVNKFCDLAKFLKNNDRFTAIAGKSLFPWKPVCTLTRANWTLIMSNSYNKFLDGSKKFHENLFGGDCYACDLLPDLFLVNLNHLKNMENLGDLKLLRVSAHVPFFLKLIGRVAYCPNYDLQYDRSPIDVEDLTCRDLSSRWDERFPLIPDLTGLYRLIKPNGVEVWLGCVWIKSAYELNLPIHCSNLARQYLFDVVDLFDKRAINLDYRIIHGTLLGAERYNDVIPWTVDVDIYPLVSVGNFTVFYESQWLNLPRLSNRTYSYFGKDGYEHLDIDKLEAVRAFPMCPLILTSRRKLDKFADSVFNVDRNRLIGEQIVKQKSIKRYNISKHDHWRNSGYVDIYTTEYLPDNCFNDSLNANYELINISNRMFKTFVDHREITKCQYGADSLTNIPNEAKTFWTWFFD